MRTLSRKIALIALAIVCVMSSLPGRAHAVEIDVDSHVEFVPEDQQEDARFCAVNGVEIVVNQMLEVYPDYVDDIRVHGPVGYAVRLDNNAIGVHGEVSMDRIEEGPLGEDVLYTAFLRGILIGNPREPNVRADLSLWAQLNFERNGAPVDGTFSSTMTVVHECAHMLLGFGIHSDFRVVNGCGWMGTEDHGEITSWEYWWGLEDGTFLRDIQGTERLAEVIEEEESIYWLGPQGTAANGGELILLAEDLGHVDQEYRESRRSIMGPGGIRGEDFRDLSLRVLDVAMLKDMLNIPLSPEIAPISDQTIDEDFELELQLEITNPVENVEYAFSAVSDTDSVTVTVEGSTFTATPRQNWFGEVEITIIASDGEDWADTVSFVLTINPVNDRPEWIREISVEPFDEDPEAPIIVCDLDTCFADPERDELTFRIPEQLGGPPLRPSIDGENVLTLRPIDNFNGTDVEVQFIVDDGNGGVIQPVFEVTVTAVNDAPFFVDENGEVIQSINVQAREGQELVVTLYGADVDLIFEGDQLTCEVYDQDGLPGEGWTFSSVNATQWRFDWEQIPYEQNNRTLYPTFVLRDRAGEEVRITVNIFVQDVNRDPRIENPIADITIDEDADTLWVDIRNVSTDDDSGDVVRPEIPEMEHFETGAQGDTLLWLVVEENWNGQEAVPVVFSDGHGGEATDSFTITVHPVNDAPLPVVLLWPEDGEEISRESVLLLWTEGQDIDNTVEELSYQVYLVIGDTTVIFTADEPQLTVDFQAILSELGYGSEQNETLDIQWNIAVSDGEYEVESERWTLIVPVPLGVEEQTGLPTEFSFSAPYPNPFNSVTTISFALPRTTSVSVIVYNLTGRMVANLVSGQFAAGQHRIVWNADGMASGTYLVGIRTPERSVVHRAVLVR